MKSKISPHNLSPLTARTQHQMHTTKHDLPTAHRTKKRRTCRYPPHVRLLASSCTPRFLNTCVSFQVQVRGLIPSLTHSIVIYNKFPLLLHSLNKIHRPLRICTQGAVYTLLSINLCHVQKGITTLHPLSKNSLLF